jgi:hypothetical protein
MKTLRFALTFLAALVVLVSASALTVAAADPVNTSPGAAASIDNQTHSINANASLWYRFDVSDTGDLGARLPVTLTLVNGSNSGVGFKVYTPSQANTWYDSDTHPVGRGTSYPINCTTGKPQQNGGCESDDLTWTSTFNIGGPYYVQVVNSNGFPVSFQLTVAGKGVSLAQPAAAPSASAASIGTKTGPVAATTTLSAGANTDNYHAATIDGQPHSIPANAGLWYQFYYDAGSPGDRPLVTVKLLNGTNSGVGFKVFTADQAVTWYDSDTHPVGQGTSYDVNCDTGVPQQGGGCQSNDLIWMGRFNFSGTFYVQVINTNSNPVTFQLTIQ